MVLGAGCAVKRERRHLLGPNCAANRVHNLGDFSCSEHRVDLRDLDLKFLAVSFRQATGDDEPAAGACLLVLGHFENGVDGLLLR